MDRPARHRTRAPGPGLWLFETVGGGRVPIHNYSGGTEISGGIVGGNVLSPLKPCAFSGPPPGMAADVVDDSGNSVQGEVGELVMPQPWIGMTRGFWKEPQRYLDSYWSRIPDAWVHGDFAVIDEDGLWHIVGRSDDTTKVAGKRIGPAEVENVLGAHPAVTEGAAIGVPDEIKGQAVVAVAVLQPDYEPGGALRAELTKWVAREMGKLLAPRRCSLWPTSPRRATRKR